MAETPTTVNDIWALQCQRGAVALMQDDNAMLTKCLIKCSALNPDKILPLERDYLWLLYAGKALLDNRIELGAAWLGHYQAHVSSHIRSTSLLNGHIADVAEQIQTKFQQALTAPDALLATERGESLDPDALLDRWVKIDVQDEASLEAAMSLISNMN